MRRSIPFLVLLAAVCAAVLLLLANSGGLGSRQRAAEEEAAALRLRESLDSEGRLRGRAGARPPVAREHVGGAPVGVLSLELGRAALEGLVTGEGAPLDGAVVRVVLEPRSLRAAVTTREDGTWKIEGLPAGSFELRASAGGWRSRTTATPAVADGATLRVEPIDLQRAHDARGTIRVRVMDEFGRPLPGARVLATTMDWAAHLGGGPEMFGVPEARSKAGRTDDTGEVVLDDLPPDAYDVVALASGYQLQAQPALQIGDGQTRLVVFRLSEGASISGILVSPDGTALEGGYVSGMHMGSFSMAATVRTAADGSFVLDGLREGSYMLFAYHDDHGEINAPGISSPSAGHRIELPGAGRIDLTVTRPDGTPVTSYRVRPYKAEPFGYTYSMSIAVEDPDGHADFPWPKGSWTIAVQSPSGDHSAETTAQVEVGQTATVAVSLAASSSVSGVVTDTDGNHVAGAEVFVRHGGFPTGPTREQYARTDGDGRFEVPGLPDEALRLHVRHAEYADRVVEVDPSPPGEGREITVVMESGASVEGRITRNGTPVEGEQVNLFVGAQWWDARTTRTDPEGRYGFEAVAPQTYNLTTGVFEFAARGASRSGIVVGESGVVQIDLDIGGVEGDGLLQGTVVQAGEPVAGARVTVIDKRGYEQSVTTTTDERGTFLAEGVVAGGTTVHVEASGGATATASATVPEGGEPGRIEIQLGSGSLAGRLVSDDGAPVSGAWIQIEIVEGDSGRRRANTMSDVEGRFAAEGLEAGRYRVRVSGGSHAAMLSPPYTLRDGQRLDLGTFTLESGATLQGRVTDDRGRPIEDATITLEDDTGRPVYLFSLVTTGSDGRYRVPGLAPGTYEVGFEARGYAPSHASVAVSSGGATADGVVARGGALEVVATDQDGTPLAGVATSLVDARGAPVRRTLSLVNLEDPSVGQTDASGRVLLADLAPGTYGITATRPGHLAPDPTPYAQVSSGERTTVRIVLGKAP